jgi:hypothetical protein
LCKLLAIKHPSSLHDALWHKIALLMSGCGVSSYWLLM